MREPLSAAIRRGEGGRRVLQKREEELQVDVLEFGGAREAAVQRQVGALGRGGRGGGEGCRRVGGQRREVGREGMGEQVRVGGGSARARGRQGL